FFFPVARSHRDLHSFPTRRSSDLQFKEGETRYVAGRIIAHRDMGKSHFLDLRDATGRIQIYIHAKEVGPELIELFRLLDIGDFIDRKSTRLNSSHDQISYAVFCLK